MNGRKARQIRKFCRDRNAYSEKAKYKVIKHKKITYILDKLEEREEPKAVPIERIQLINVSKFTYRRIKKAYKRGEIII